MKQVTREQWTTALRSGQYKQCKGRLYRREEDAYCCLGVLGVLAGGEPARFDGLYFGDSHEKCALPVGVAEMIGLDCDKQLTLIRMNDTLNNTFEEIANYIDHHLS